MTSKQIEELVLKGIPLYVNFPFNLKSTVTNHIGENRITEKQFKAIKSKYEWNFEHLDRKHKYTIKK